MQNVLGKRLDQEEVYCTFGLRDIFQSFEGDPHAIPKHQLLDFARRLENFQAIRFIVLEAIPEGQQGKLLGKNLTNEQRGKKLKPFVYNDKGNRT